MTSFNQSLIGLFQAGTRELNVGLLTHLPDEPRLGNTLLHYWGYYNRNEPNGARVAAFGLEPPADSHRRYWPPDFIRDGAVAVVIRPAQGRWEEAELLSLQRRCNLCPDRQKVLFCVRSLINEALCRGGARSTTRRLPSHHFARVWKFQIRPGHDKNLQGGINGQNGRKKH